MKEKRKKYEKPQSFVIEMEQPLLSAVSDGGSIGISGEPVDKPGRFGAPRYEDEDDWDEQEWS